MNIIEKIIWFFTPEQRIDRLIYKAITIADDHELYDMGNDLRKLTGYRKRKQERIDAVTTHRQYSNLPIGPNPPAPMPDVKPPAPPAPPPKRSSSTY